MRTYRAAGQPKIVVKQAVLENILHFLIFFSRVRDLLDLDLEAEAMKSSTNEVMWAVFTAFIK